MAPYNFLAPKDGEVYKAGPRGRGRYPDAGGVRNNVYAWSSGKQDTDLIREFKGIQPLSDAKGEPMKRQLIQLVGGLIALGVVGTAVPTNAQVTPFQIVGHIDHFCLDNQFDVTGACPKDSEPRAAIPPKSPTNIFIGAKMVVNGVAVTIPSNTVVLMPATYLTPWQIFDQAQGISRGNNESGLALHDKTRPLAAFEVAIDGNIVCLPVSAPGCTNTYVAGQVHISQQSLNLGAGFIRQINVTPTLADPTNGFICVGANPAPLPPAASCAAPNTRIHLNDPKITDLNDGRYGVPNIEAGLPTSTDPNSRFPDPRFTVDQGNPTIHALTGYPMCVPRSSTDSKCPSQNRLAGQSTFVMDKDPLQPPPAFGPQSILPCELCKPEFQAPFMVGDYVTFSGTLAADINGKYVSVHTMVANIGIYTKGKIAYVTLDESLLGTKGNIILCGSTAECQDRIKVEGFTTDPTRAVNIYAVDIAGAGGAQTVRRLTNTPNPNGVGLVNTAKDQAVWGRFRYVTGKNAGVLFDSNSVLKGATRELMAKIDDDGPLPDGSLVPTTPQAANGLIAGIYIAPIGEYIFPEPTGVQGGSLPALNFQCLAFLVTGWKLPDNGLPSIPPLNPWPGGGGPILNCAN